MEIIGCFGSERPERWLEQIAGSGWSAGKYLRQLLCEGTFHDAAGCASTVLLTDGAGRLLPIRGKRRCSADMPQALGGLCLHVSHLQGNTAAGKTAGRGL